MRQLQKFLNARGFQIAQTGPGSPGNETDYFGAKTEAALIRFQEANALAINLVKFTGLFGDATRSFVNGLISAPVLRACTSNSQIEALLAEVARNSSRSSTVRAGRREISY